MELTAPRHSGPRKALFVTFYSFKGGVGRTMALLNTATLLAGLGRRVLMVDFDLEAPGLTLFQDRQRGPGTASRQSGLVDALTDFMERPQDAPLAGDDPSAFLDAYVAPLDVPESLQKIDGGCLHLLPTGRLDDNYESRLYRLPFGDLFEQGVGVPMFEHLKSLIRDSERYDYVFVDSRTGFSDEGSICTRYLADALLVVTGLNRQNLRGTARFLTQSGVGKREGTPRRIGFVASPVPVFYEDLKAERMRVAEQVLADAGLADARFVAEIPYHPILALDEDPHAHDLTATALYDAYRDIEAVVRTWADDLPEQRVSEAFDALYRGRMDDALGMIRRVRQERPRLLLQMLAAAGSLVEQRPVEMVPVLEERLSIAREWGDPDDVMDALDALDSAYGLAGNSGSAIPLVEEALAIAREVGDRRAESYHLGNLASRLAVLGRAEEAAALAEDAVAIAREIGDRRAESYRLGILSNRLAELGRVEATGLAEDALAIAREVGDRRAESYHLGNLAGRFAELGRVEEAAALSEDALAIAREVGDRRAESYQLGSLANRLAELGRVAEATGLAEAALAIARELGDRNAESYHLGNLANRFAELGRAEEAVALTENALAIAREVGDRRAESYHLGNRGIALAMLGIEEEARHAVGKGLHVAGELSQLPLTAQLLVDEIELLAHLASNEGLIRANEVWDTIVDEAPAFEHARAQVLRARLRAAHNDSAGAVMDAEEALILYRANGADSRWSREAEAIVKENGASA